MCKFHQGRRFFKLHSEAGYMDALFSLSQTKFLAMSQLIVEIDLLN